MKKGKAENAVGKVLVCDTVRIIPCWFKGDGFKKARSVREEDIPGRIEPDEGESTLISAISALLKIHVNDLLKINSILPGFVEGVGQRDHKPSDTAEMGRGGFA